MQPARRMLTHQGASPVAKSAGRKATRTKVGSPAVCACTGAASLARGITPAVAARTSRPCIATSSDAVRAPPHAPPRGQAWPSPPARRPLRCLPQQLVSHVVAAELCVKAIHIALGKPAAVAATPMLLKLTKRHTLHCAQRSKHDVAFDTVHEPLTRPALQSPQQAVLWRKTG